MSRFGIGLLLCIAGAAWLRLDQLLYQVLEGDEWHALHQLTYYSIPQTLRTYGANDFGIPVVLYYWTLSKIGALTELAMRLPMLLSGIGLVILLPLLLRRRLQDDRITLIFAALLAVAPFLVYWSRMARTYSITLFTIFLAFGLLALALRQPASRRWTFPAYALLCGFTVWAHALTGPMLISPLLALWIQAFRSFTTPLPHRNETLVTRDLIRLTVMTGGCMALAVLPPLLGDMNALAGKSGVDSPTLATLTGAFHHWVGSSSGIAVLAAVLLAALGTRRIWRSIIEVRWAALGLALTVAALLVAQPWWVDRPLALARYLLPLLPCLLLTIAAGIVQLADLLDTPSLRNTRSFSAFFLALALLGFWWPTTPAGEWLRKPNSYTSHMYFQYDYRREGNPVRATMAQMPNSSAWQSLASQPTGSVLIAAAPFQYATWEWPAPLWEQASRQRVIPGFLSGACEQNRQGEVPDDGRFHLRNGVHLNNRAALAARSVDWVAYYLSPESAGFSARLPHCEAWLREHYGVPDYEDAAILAWSLADREDGP